ncbi:Mbov_0400 family ICE element protein [Mycoplasma procyoni]|uniref:Mbov_0400 family ICE element protein n=1 Tax=Mycoplasma procyoni TaxID=568784 RepID=UPI00197C597F|nr:hypothetical protein [Mycoplasma procyoni]MBN3534663.1 hypothetical protein [Mycoplasma procyoni]
MSLKDILNFKKRVQAKPEKVKGTGYENSITFTPYENLLKARPVIIFYDEDEKYYYYIKSRTASEKRKPTKYERLVKASSKPNSLFDVDSWLNATFIHKMKKELFEKYIDEKQYLENLEIDNQEIDSLYGSILKNLFDIPPTVALIEVFENENKELEAKTLYCHENILKEEERKINNGDFFLLKNKTVLFEEVDEFSKKVLENNDKYLSQLYELRVGVYEDSFNFRSSVLVPEIREKEREQQEKIDSLKKWEFKDGDLSKIANTTEIEENLLIDVFNQRINTFKDYKEKRQYLSLIKDIDNNLISKFKNNVLAYDILQLVVDEKATFDEINNLIINLKVEKTNLVKNIINDFQIRKAIEEKTKEEEEQQQTQKDQQTEEDKEEPEEEAMVMKM